MRDERWDKVIGLIKRGACQEQARSRRAARTSNIGVGGI